MEVKNLRHTSYQVCYECTNIPQIKRRDPFSNYRLNTSIMVNSLTLKDLL